MDPPHERLIYLMDPDPRIRGDGPDTIFMGTKDDYRPPHTRGWTYHVVGWAVPLLQTPAYAGMDLASECGVDLVLADPRIRGDGPAFDLVRLHRFGRPPHTRGWT